ncbi:MAG: hypothetical protein IJW51_02355 [Clostridia bacterium]|nr:hypothetical protein [Clostridia bacterium]
MEPVTAAAMPHHETVADNLAHWQCDIDRAQELSLLQIKDALHRHLAHTKADGTPDAADLRQFAADLCPLEPDAEPLHHAQQVSRRLAFCRALCALHPDFKGEEASAPTTKAPIQSPTVAKLSNPTFEEALLRFSPLVPRATALICHSFGEILEAVSAGKAPFGLIPLEDSAEGKLFRFYEQIEQQELQIVATVDIPTANEGRQVRIALLHKQALDAPHAPGEQILECRLFEDRTTSLLDLLTIAKSEGLSLRRIDSLPVTYRDDGFFKHLVWEAGQRDLNVFLAYLALFMPRTAVTAHYIHLS